MVRRVASGNPRGNPRWILLAAVAAALWWVDIAAGTAQELPSGGGPVPSLRRGAPGQSQIAPPGGGPRAGLAAGGGPGPGGGPPRPRADRVRAASRRPPSGGRQTRHGSFIRPAQTQLTGDQGGQRGSHRSGCGATAGGTATAGYHG